MIMEMIAFSMYEDMIWWHDDFTSSYKFSQVMIIAYLRVKGQVLYHQMR